MSIPELVKQLLERTQSASWVVVLKALLTMHDLMNYGNEVLEPLIISLLFNDQ